MLRSPLRSAPLGYDAEALTTELAQKMSFAPVGRRVVIPIGYLAKGT
jgi:hypothetical protein